jgi:hypothetical protein
MLFPDPIAVEPRLVEFDAHEKALVQPHVLGHKRLQVEYDLAPHLAPVLVESCPLDHLRLQRIVRLRNQLPSQRLDDGCRIDAMREQVVERRADDQ